MPTGSGEAIRAAGIWKTGVSSPQLEVRNSIGNDTGDPADEQHDDIGERKASALAAVRKPAEDDPDEGVIAPPIGDRAADERQDRQRQPCDLVGPQEGVAEITPRSTLASTSTSSPSSAATTTLSAARSTRRSSVRSGFRQGAAARRKQQSARPIRSVTISIALCASAQQRNVGNTDNAGHVFHLPTCAAFFPCRVH